MSKISISITAIAFRIFVLTAAAANTPSIEWQRSYGGTNTDIIYALEPGVQGELVMAGVATSPGYWLLRMDSAGNPLSEIRHHGDDADVATACKILPDGGFYLAGYSYSGASGSKSSTNFGGADYWVLRLDASGNKIWDRSFGGQRDDFLTTLALSEDGGCLLGGMSAWSTNGNKTSLDFGSEDYWVVRLGSDGSKLWERSFGTTNSDTLQYVLPIGGNGYLLAGSSRGIPSGTTGGNRTNTGFGNFDYWLVRIDAAGNRLWETAYGGSSSDVLLCAAPTSDGGFVLGGRSSSDSNGTKLSQHYGGGDYWVVRIDANGQQVWDWAFGGTGQDDLQRIEAVGDGFILAGRSTSPISGNKESPSFGSGDYWIVRIDGNGAKLWELSLGGTDDDWPYGIRQTTDGGWVVGGSSRSGANGNKTTPPLRSGGGLFFERDDVWVVKIALPGVSLPPSLRWEEVSPQHRLLLRGTSNFTYRTEVSRDFVSWTPFRTNQVGDSDVEVFREQLNTPTNRFFRARTLP